MTAALFAPRIIASLELDLPRNFRRPRLPPVGRLRMPPRTREQRSNSDSSASSSGGGQATETVPEPRKRRRSAEELDELAILKALMEEEGW